MGCHSCGADWTSGHWSPGCRECGGGALELECGLCFGTCGRALTRAVADSNDLRLAHWIGSCARALPMPEVFARTQALAELLSSPEGRRLSDLALAGAGAAPPGAAVSLADFPALEVLRDWLQERGVETGRRWLWGRLCAAAARGRPLASALLD